MNVGKKKGKMNSVKRIKKVPRQAVQKTNTSKQQEPQNSDDDVADMLEMVDDEDIQFLKSAITNRSYDFLNKVAHVQYVYF